MEKTVDESKARPDVGCTELLDCQCGFTAGQVGYNGGRSGRWSIRCTRSTCPAIAESDSKAAVVRAWNHLQSNAEVSR